MNVPDALFHDYSSITLDPCAFVSVLPVSTRIFCLLFTFTFIIWEGWSVQAWANANWETILAKPNCQSINSRPVECWTLSCPLSLSPLDFRHFGLDIWSMVYLMAVTHGQRSPRAHANPAEGLHATAQKGNGSPSNRPALTVNLSRLDVDQLTHYCIQLAPLPLASECDHCVDRFWKFLTWTQVQPNLLITFDKG